MWLPGSNWPKLLEMTQKMTRNDLREAAFGSLVIFCARLGEIGKNSVRLAEKLVKKISDFRLSKKICLLYWVALLSPRHAFPLMLF